MSRKETERGAIRKCGSRHRITWDTEDGKIWGWGSKGETGQWWGDGKGDPQKYIILNWHNGL